MPEEVEENAVRYAGLNVRMLANLFDMLLLMVAVAPLLMLRPEEVELPTDTPPQVIQAYQLRSSGQINDEQFTSMVLESGYLQNNIIPKIISYLLINVLFVGIVYVICWKRWDSTPGKLIFGLKIIDDKTMSRPTTRQYLIRFVGYYISAIPLCIGYLMIMFTDRKRGLHDIMAGTAVIYSRRYDAELEKKKTKWKAYFTVALLIIGAILLSTKL